MFTSKAFSVISSLMQRLMLILLALPLISQALYAQITPTFLDGDQIRISFTDVQNLSPHPVALVFRLTLCARQSEAQDPVCQFVEQSPRFGVKGQQTVRNLERTGPPLNGSDLNQIIRRMELSGQPQIAFLIELFDTGNNSFRIQRQFVGVPGNLASLARPIRRPVTLQSSNQTPQYQIQTRALLEISQ